MIFDTIYIHSLQLWWIPRSIAHGISIYLILKLIIHFYKENSEIISLRKGNGILEKMVDAMEPYTSKWKLTAYRSFLKKLIRKSGLRGIIRPSAVIARQCVYGFLSFTLSYIFFSIILDLSMILAIIVSACMMFLPISKLQSICHNRRLSFKRDLPFFIDYLSLCIDAGLEFNECVSVVIEDANPSPLRDEFSLLLKNIKLGRSREESLRELEGRLQTPEGKVFTQTMIQSMSLGNDVGHTLKIISESLHAKRFNLAEESAGKISVRMMLPLMIFVLPATLIILLGPMLLQWIQSI